MSTPKLYALRESTRRYLDRLREQECLLEKEHKEVTDRLYAEYTRTFKSGAAAALVVEVVVGALVALRSVLEKLNNAGLKAVQAHAMLDSEVKAALAAKPVSDLTHHLGTRAAVQASIAGSQFKRELIEQVVYRGLKSGGTAVSRPAVGTRRDLSFKDGLLEERRVMIDELVAAMEDVAADTSAATILQLTGVVLDTFDLGKVAGRVTARWGESQVCELDRKIDAYQKTYRDRRRVLREAIRRAERCEQLQSRVLAAGGA